MQGVNIIAIPIEIGRIQIQLGSTPSNWLDKCLIKEHRINRTVHTLVSASGISSIIACVNCKTSLRSTLSGNSYNSTLYDAPSPIGYADERTLSAHRAVNHMRMSNKEYFNKTNGLRLVPPLGNLLK